MSMIFSALREIDKPGDPLAAPTPAIAPPARRSLAPWIAAGAVLAGGAAAATYLWLQQPRSSAAQLSEAAPAPVASVAVAPLPATTAAEEAGVAPRADAAPPLAPAESLASPHAAAPTEPVESLAAPTSASAPPPAAPLPTEAAPAGPAAATPSALPPAAALPEATPVVAAAPERPAAPAAIAEPVPAPQRPAGAVRVSAPAPVDHGAQEARVALQVETFNAAMASGELEAAGRALAQLRRELRPESITLLRMSAWHAMAGGQAEQARLLYGEILHRLPGDENAGINAAILAWDAGRHDTAREIIERLRLHHPDSELIKRYRKAMQGS